MNGEKWKGIALGAILLFSFLLYLSIFYNAVPSVEKEYKEKEYKGFKEITIRKGNGLSKIAFLKIEGGIDAVFNESAVEILKEVENNKNIAGLILEIDSGGGNIYSSFILARKILEIRKKKPVVANILSAA